MRIVKFSLKILYQYLYILLSHKLVIKQSILKLKMFDILSCIYKKSYRNVLSYLYSACNTQRLIYYICVIKVLHQKKKKKCLEKIDTEVIHLFYSPDEFLKD